MCNCVNLKERYDGYTIKDLIELSPFVTSILEDFINWKAEYICNDCGQEWCETYIATGRGEIPIVHKKEIRVNNSN